MGFSILIVDLDLVFLKDPFAHLYRDAGAGAKAILVPKTEWVCFGTDLRKPTHDGIPMKGAPARRAGVNTVGVDRWGGGGVVKGKWVR